MASPDYLPTSFSAGRRWSILFSVTLSIAAAVAIMVMLNYLGARHFLRFSWSAKASPGLSPRTLGVIKTITNDVKVTMYYDTGQNDLWKVISSLLNEYQVANPKISVRVVDYKRDAALAREVKAQYKLNSPDDVDLVIFDCNSNVDKVPDKLLWDYNAITPQKTTGGQMEFERKLKSFLGESIFSAVLLDVVDTNYQNAYYVEGDGESGMNDSSEGGYTEFRDLLVENHLRPMTLDLSGPYEVPADCQLLVLAGPTRLLATNEVGKISRYLAQGGNLMVLFNNYYNSSSRNFKTGLENLLTQWGVQAGLDVVSDPDNTDPGNKMILTAFNAKHPITEHLDGYKLSMVFPRSIRKPASDERGSETSSVDELLFTGPRAMTTSSSAAIPGRAPVAAAVHKLNVKNGVAGTSESRLVVCGDSLFLRNQLIGDFANRDFARFATAWLTKQTRFLKDIGPRKMVTYDLNLTHAQTTAINWIFLGAMPGGILLFGGLVWLRRRH